MCARILGMRVKVVVDRGVVGVRSEVFEASMPEVRILHYPERCSRHPSGELCLPHLVSEHNKSPHPVALLVTQRSNLSIDNYECD